MKNLQDKNKSDIKDETYGSHKRSVRSKLVDFRTIYSGKEPDPEMTRIQGEQVQELSIFETSPDSKMYDYRISLDKVKDALYNYGLTANQAKVYIFLGKYGSKTAPDVCKALRLPRTETYHLLTTLQNKGIVSATFQHPIKFSALSLNKAVWALVNAEKERVKVLESQEKELVKLWENIPDFQTEEQQTVENKFQMLQGTNQIHSKINEMIGSAKKEFFVLGTEKDFLKFYHSDFLAPLDNSQVNLKLLTSSSDRTMYIFDEVDRTKVKRVPPGGIQENLCFIIKDNDELVFFMKNASQPEPQLVAMWTDSNSMIHSMKLLFGYIWDKSKNVHL